MVNAFSVGGSPEHLAGRVLELGSLGVRHFICTLRGDPFERMAERIQEVGKALASVIE